MLSPLKTPLFPLLSCRPQLRSHFEALSRIYHVGFKAHGFWASVTDVRRLCGEVLQSRVLYRISKLHLQDGRLEVLRPFSIENIPSLANSLLNHMRVTSSAAAPQTIQAS